MEEFVRVDNGSIYFYSPNERNPVGILKWYLVYRVATRGRRRRRAEARERELLPTLFDVADADSSLVDICEECGEVFGDHLVDDEELLCP